MESFIEHYGYLAILVGTFLEGETILILGGVAAQRGYLDLHWVILAAFCVGLLGMYCFWYTKLPRANIEDEYPIADYVPGER